MYIDDKLNDVVLQMQSLEQQGKTNTREYRELERYKAVLLETINAR